MEGECHGKSNFIIIRKDRMKVEYKHILHYVSRVWVAPAIRECAPRPADLTLTLCQPTLRPHGEHAASGTADTASSMSSVVVRTANCAVVSDPPTTVHRQ